MLLPTFVFVGSSMDFRSLSTVLAGLICVSIVLWLLLISVCFRGYPSFVEHVDPPELTWVGVWAAFNRRGEPPAVYFAV